VLSSYHLGHQPQGRGRDFLWKRFRKPGSRTNHISLAQFLNRL
jgi:hypothetical protein